MKVAHFSRFVPNQSGQYGTVKDLIKAERGLGVDAGFIAPMMGQGVETSAAIARKDGWLQTEKMEWADDADILVRHVLVPSKMVHSGKQAKVMCLHGRPENSFLLGIYSLNAVYNTVYYERKTWDMFVTFWEEFKFHWSQLIDDSESRLRYVPAMCDLDLYNPEGDKRDLGELSGKPNIVIADMWREDTTPYNVLHAAAYFKANYCPEAAIHVYGIPKDKKSIVDLNRILKNKGVIGETIGLCRKMEKTFRAADIVVTPHVIATRVIRESMSCGTPIVAGGDCPYTQYGGDPRNIQAFAKEINRCWEDIKVNPDLGKDFRLRAEKEFNLEQTGRAMIAVFDEVLKRRKDSGADGEYAIRQEQSRSAKRRQQKQSKKQLKMQQQQQIKHFMDQRQEIAAQNAINMERKKHA